MILLFKRGKRATLSPLKRSENTICLKIIGVLGRHPYEWAGCLDTLPFSSRRVSFKRLVFQRLGFS